ncbi:MAG: hypothetical protein JXR83_19895, partial [Deltaproteobacteria bacterium]|nr:hypothetical protein [Deltaproteobacteria bacterium]
MSADGLRDKFGDFVAEGKKRFSYQAFQDFMRQSGEQAAPSKRTAARKQAARRQRARVVDSEAAASSVEATWDDGPASFARPAPRAAGRTSAPRRGTGQGGSRRSGAGRRGRGA